MKNLTIKFDLYKQELRDSYEEGFATCFELVTKKLINDPALGEDNAKKLLRDFCDEHDMPYSEKIRKKSIF
jgi:hypothetical protein